MWKQVPFGVLAQYTGSQMYRIERVVRFSRSHLRVFFNGFLHTWRRFAQGWFCVRTAVTP